MTNETLIKKAASVVKTRHTKNGLFGDVGCAVLSDKDIIYVGTCAAAGSNTICAEQVALSSMMTAGEYKFKKIVAVWKDKKGKIFVIPPCGNCRQFMKEMSEDNLSSKIILNKNKSVSLKTLLPFFDWWKKQS